MLKRIDIKAIRKLAEYGHTDQFIANFLGVSLASWLVFRKNNPVFNENYTAWKDTADERVERALYERAIGCERFKDVATKDGGTVRISESALPDTAACVFWLKNRKPDEWKDKSTSETKVTMDATVQAKVDEIDLEDRIGQIVENRLSDML